VLIATAIDAGLSIKEFWEMCPIVFHEVVRLKKLRCRQQLYETGIIATTIINASQRKKGAKPVTVEMLLPSLKTSSKKKKQSVESMIHIAERITMAFGGRDLRKNKQPKKED